jgi:hypothetical protein
MAVEVGGWGWRPATQTQRRERKKIIDDEGSLALIPIVKTILN